MYNYKETKMNMCEYGCGNPAKFVLKNGRNSCSKYSTQCPMNKKKNSIGLETAYYIYFIFTGNDVEYYGISF